MSKKISAEQYLETCSSYELTYSANKILSLSIFREAKKDNKFFSAISIGFFNHRYVFYDFMRIFAHVFTTSSDNFEVL